jgi:L-histidine Nalpha-methyltransferase
MSVNLPTFVSCLRTAAQAPAEELAAGLMQPAATIAPKFFYDSLGSALFAAITQLDEYYPTRTEAAIFASEQGAIAQALHARLAPGFTLLDLGAGDGAKAASLFGALRPGRYVAVDISEPYLREALTALQQRFPALPMTGVGLDFGAALQLPAGVVDGPALVFYPGSSIGNFGPDEALRLLVQARAASQGGALLIGADLMKPPAVLQAAYDDALGVTAAFNLNLLRNVNHLLRSNFEPAEWAHVARVNLPLGRVEMHLRARHAVAVRWPGGERRFEAGESIHTENSYKWKASAFEALLREAGWRDVRCHTDSRGWFGVFLAFAE